MNNQDAAHVHPEYTANVGYWKQMSDTIEGEKTVKEAGETYLPMTDGMLKLENADKIAVYDAYKKRAVYTNFPEETAEAILGLMHSKEATIELPAKLEEYEKQMTPDGYNIHTLIRYMNRQQIEKGRMGMLADVKEGSKASDLPYVSVYCAESIENWNSAFIDGEEVLTFVVLNESGMSFENGTWEESESYLVLFLDDQGYGQYTTDNIGQITETPDEDDFDIVRPAIGNKTLDRIPFVFANSRDTTTSVSKPPLLSIANLALATYRQDADYRSGLFFGSQATLTATGVQEDQIKNAVIGSYSCLYSDNKDAKFGYAEIAGNALDAARTAVTDLKNEATRRGVSFVEMGPESGNALENRMSSKTASVKTIVATGKAAMLKMLEIICEWSGANFSEVVVDPNMDFIEDNLTAADLSSLMGAKMQGAPIAYESIHGWMKDRGYTSLDWETEKEKIMEELLDFAPPEPTSSTFDDEDEEPIEEDEEEETDTE